MNLVSVADVIRAISDEESLYLFRFVATVATSSLNRSAKTSGQAIDTSTLMSKINLTKKQFYSRMSALISAGLVRRYNGKYMVTSLGKVVYNAQAIVDNAVKDYWRLKAIDTIEANLNSELPEEEHHKLVDILLSNGHLKDILGSSAGDRTERDEGDRLSGKTDTAKRHLPAAHTFESSIFPLL